MTFASLLFLLYWVLVAAAHRALGPSSARRALLLVASYLFYASWDVRFVLLLAGVSLNAWLGARAIAAAATADRRKALTGTFVSLNVLALALFKYLGFLDGIAAGLFGVHLPGATSIALPVGISFYSFQAISYLVDVHRGKVRADAPAADVFLYLALFPHLLSGPIVRAGTLLPQLRQPPRASRADALAGVQLFLVGLVQKRLFADTLAFFTAPVFQQPMLYDGATLFLAMLAFTLQIYCDFSGYSLMAIGVSRTLGFSIPDNFDSPYLSGTVTEFWRRWHISLSTFLRDYVYIPLGGSRRGNARANVNLVLTMLVGGLWHGAGWNFVAWGGLHGLGLVVQKEWSARVPLPAAGPGLVVRRALGHGALLLFVALLWVPFRSAGFDDTVAFVSRLATAAPGLRWLHTGSVWLVGLMAAWHVAQAAWPGLARLVPTGDATSWRSLFVVGMLIGALALFAPVTTSPFLYFSF